MRYSPLEQINTGNVRSLEVARDPHDTGDVSDGSELPTRSAFETTPLMIDGGRKRISLTDQLGRLFSIDTETRRLDPGFGNDGMVDLSVGIGLDEFPHLRYGVTGELAWRFHTVPRPGEYGHHTWEGDSWRDRSGVNAWSTLSFDKDLEWVFVPLTSPGTDFYGEDRKGANLFSDSIVAIDCRTGKRQWHFQTIHHDLWDWDLPGYPNLITIEREGKEIPAVAQITKTGFFFAPPCHGTAPVSG